MRLHLLPLTTGGPVGLLISCSRPLAAVAGGRAHPPAEA